MIVKNKILISGQIFLLLLLSAGSLFAQLKVEGSVKENGKPLSGAQITLASDETGTKKETTTNSSGSFSFSLKANEEYSIFVTKAGYIKTKIMYSTMGFSEEEAKKFKGTSNPEVELFRLPEDEALSAKINEAFEKPMVSYFYNADKGAVVADDEENASMLDEYAKLQNQAEDFRNKNVPIETKYNIAIGRADKAYNAKDYEGAIAACKEALALKPAEMYPKNKMNDAEKQIAIAADNARLAKEKEGADAVEKERLAKEKALADAAEKERLAKAKADADAAEKAKLAKQKEEADAIAAQKAKDKEAADALEKAKLAKQKEEADAIAAQKAKDKEAADALEKAKLAKQKEEADALAAEKAKADKEKADAAEKTRLAKEAEVAEAAERARIEKEKIAAAIVEKAKAEKEKADAAAAERDRIAKEKAEAAEKARVAKEAEIAAANAEKARIAKEKADAEAAEKARLAREKAVNDSIEKIRLTKLAAEKLINDKYNRFITVGDSLVSAENFEAAKGAFKEAMKVKENESYPKTRLTDIDEMIKNNELYKNDLAKKYPVGVTEEKTKEKNMNVTRRIVVIGNKGYLYEKKETAFGAVYYFKDGVVITEKEYTKDTEIKK